MVKLIDYTDYENRLCRLNKEKGSALLIAMIMLVVLTVIGAATMNTSTTEVIISGNYKTMKEAFYNTERVTEYAIAQPDIYSATNNIIGTSVSVPLAADNVSSVPLGKNIFSNIISGNVTLTREMNAPVGSGLTGRVNVFLIDVTGSGPANAESRQIVEKWLPKME